MKDQEFLGLLNLYLDHEISAADAARLEAEVQASPQRRALYTEYCRMQKACTVLGADFRTAGEVTFDPAVAAVERARQRRRTAFYGFGSLAAAACVAFILAGRSPAGSLKDSPGSAPIAAATVAPAAAPKTGGIQQRPMLVSDSLLLSDPSRPDAELTLAGRRASDQLAWIQNVRLAPLQLGVSANELRFESAPISLRPEGRPLGSPAATAVSVETAAFRFEK